MTSVTVTGIEKAISINNSIGNKKKQMLAMEQMVIETVMLIQNRCPKDTGKLVNTINYTKTSNGFIIYVGGDEAPYAYFMEYGFRGFDIGTVEHPIFKKSGFHPFIRSSVWEKNKEYQQYIRRILFKVE